MFYVYYLYNSNLIYSIYNLLFTYYLLSQLPTHLNFAIPSQKKEKDNVRTLTIQREEIYIGIEIEKNASQAAAQHINSLPESAAPAQQNSHVTTHFMSHRPLKKMKMVDGVNMRRLRGSSQRQLRW